MKEKMEMIKGAVLSLKDNIISFENNEFRKYYTTNVGQSNKVKEEGYIYHTTNVYTDLLILEIDNLILLFDTMSNEIKKEIVGVDYYILDDERMSVREKVHVCNKYIKHLLNNSSAYYIHSNVDMRDNWVVKTLCSISSFLDVLLLQYTKVKNLR